MLRTIKNINGAYKSGIETLHFNSKNKSFFLIRNLPKLQDVAIPICYDTIATGNFKPINRTTFSLFNDQNFFKAHYNFRQEKNLSEDTIYIKILLPQDDAFFSDRFRYLFNFGCMVRAVKSDSTFIKIPKSVMKNCESTFLSFLVQDLYPQWCIEEEKCYQRIYFRIFNLLRVNNKENYFTITLWNFNECFVERMDVENDIIYFDGKNNIHWRGKNFKKVNKKG